jgi:hypothetical protein
MYTMKHNSATRSASQSGTYAIERPRSEHPPAPSDLLADELRRRLAAMPTEDLVRLLSVAPAAPVAEAEGPAPTVRTLIRRVLGRSALPSQEVVRRVQTLRPGTPGPTVRSDLSRMRVEGELTAVGPVRGGRLKVVV